MNAIAKVFFNPQRNREVAISVVHTFAAVVKITADVCPDPVASAVLKTAFAIYEEAMKVSELKDRIKNLGQSINALSDIIARIQTTKSVLDGQPITEDNKVVKQLEELSKEILEKLNKWNRYSRFRAWVNLRHLTKSLDTYHERIQEMSGVYEMANSAKIVTNLQRANEILNQCHKLMKDIFADRSAAKKLEEVQRLIEEAENTPEPYVIEEVFAPGISTDLCPVKQRRCDGHKEYVAKKIKYFQPEKHPFVRKKLDACIKHFENLPPHPNIMKAREVVETTYGEYNRSAFFVISERQPCNLFNFCEKDENKNLNVFTLLAETAEALVHMHKHGVAHGCVRGANILVSAEGRALVHDFELTRFFTDRHDYPDMDNDLIEAHEDLATNRLNTVGRWMCPEIFASDAPGWETVEFLVRKEWQTPEGDVWSFGMLILELFTKRRPYNSQRAPGYFYRTICMRELPEFPDREDWEQVPWMSQEVFDFMLEMFAIDWNKRPTMQCVAERMRKLEKEYVPRK